LEYEATTKYKTYGGVYNALGYGGHYVPTYETSHEAKVKGKVTTTTPVGSLHGASYYSPKVTAALTPALRNTYAGWLYDHN
jgi:hypothetical protein